MTLEQAARELLRLKDLANDIDRLRQCAVMGHLTTDESRDLEAWKCDYEANKPKAWDALRAALAAHNSFDLAAEKIERGWCQLRNEPCSEPKCSIWSKCGTQERR
jgi:hypothetical protein